MRRARRHPCRMRVKGLGNCARQGDCRQAHTAHIVETEDISLTQDKRVVCARGSVCFASRRRIPRSECACERLLVCVFLLSAFVRLFMFTLASICVCTCLFVCLSVPACA